MIQPEVPFPHMLKYGLIFISGSKCKIPYVCWEKKGSMLPWKSIGSIYEENVRTPFKNCIRTETWHGDK